MWSWLLFYRRGRVRIIAILAFVAIGVYLSVFLELSWYIYIPVAALAYLIIPIAWGLFLGILDKRTYEQEVKRISGELTDRK
jgi:hypothetical protein